jgi:DNA repair protein RecN (Recombination protein N)
MLVHVSIVNFALIDQLSLSFEKGFQVITGETGAGKSILLGALGLVLGKRADTQALRDKEKKCIIECHFDIKAYQLESFFADNDWDYEPITILRRELLPSGKSRAFVNDIPVTVSDLTVLGEMLIDIHSQHQTSELTESAFQLRVLDALAGHQLQVDQYKTAWKKLKQLEQDLEHKSVAYANALKEQDYNQFLWQELDEVRLEEGQQEEWERELQLLDNAQSIREEAAKILQLNQMERFGLQSQLVEVKQALSRIASYVNEASDLHKRTESLLIEWEDVVQEVERISERVEDNPKQLLFLQEKLQLLYQLQKKHQVQSITELLQIKNDLEHKVNATEDLQADIEKLTIEKTQKLSELTEVAKQLSAQRKKSAEVFVNKAQNILSEVGMPHARFRLDWKNTETLTPTGIDQIEWLFSANAGGEFGMMKKVASGGEMSRIMLAIKAIMCEYKALPTIIFDEIDTGVSGDIAQKMGSVMQQMGVKMQVFAITHLPQIAALGSHHFKVYKTVDQNETVSSVEQLIDNDRVIEIAKMLSGSDVSSTALEHAKVLLSSK